MAWRAPTQWAPVSVTASLAVGATAAFDLTAAVGLASVLAFLPLVALRPALLLPALMATVFLSVLAVQGVTIGRIVAPVALFVVVLALLRGQATLRPSAPLAWVFAYGCWALASGLWTVSIEGTLFELSSLAIAVTYMLAFATLIASAADLRHAVLGMSLVALGVGVLAILSAQGRAEGVSGDANEFAVVEIMAIPLGIALAAEGRAGIQRLLLYALLGVAVVGVFASLSRGGIVALAIILLLVLIVPASTFFRSGAQKAMVLLLLAVAVFVAFRVSGDALTPRLNAIFAQEDRTGSGRLNAWRAAWTSIRERPALGLGYGAFDPSANELMLRTPGVDLSNQTLRPGGLKAHSTYIGTLAELGLPGLLLLLGLLASTGRVLVRTAASARRVGQFFIARTAVALLISLVGWMLATLFLSAETSRPLWIIIGIALALPRLASAAATRPAPAGR